MPEGPEIRLAADRIAKVLVGREIAEAYFGIDRLRPFAEKLTGRRVDSVDTRGKAMLTRFSGGLTLYSHNQLYGRWFTTRRGKTPNTGRSLRVALHTDTHSAWLYSASDVGVLTRQQLLDHPFLSRIGPDILSAELTASKVRNQLMEKSFRGRSLGALYLDQRFLAGIGNYLRSEILYTSGLHHTAKPRDLDAAALQRLARETLKISRRSYSTKGVTVTSALQKKLKSQGCSYGQYRFWVFGREGRQCHRCGDEILRTTVASRNLFFCPGCQADATP